MAKPLRVLMVEDEKDDATLLLLELRRGGFDPVHARVEDATALREALRNDSWDIVICDHVMPRFDSFMALEIVREERLDLPFIVVSGTVGEDIAVEVMKSGANDYLLKDSLIRLVPAIERELVEAESRRQRRRVEDQLRQARKMETVGQLTGGLAHDFNNLLAIILGNAEFLEDRLGHDDEALRPIIKAAERGAELTKRLLAFSRQQPLVPQAIDLGKLVSGMSNMIARTLGETIEIEIADASNVWRALADPGQVENALLNLALNARDAMPRGGKLTVEYANVHLDETYVAQNPEAKIGDYVVLAVSDKGSGMTAEVRDHAFEPFFTTKAVGQGSGLGLSMVHGFAQQSAGHVNIYSEEGKGTTVKLYLPRAKGAAQSHGPSQDKEIPQGKGEMVLVIEDDRDVRALTVQMLNGLGYKVIDVANAASAHAVLAEGKSVDLVLSDVVLPGGVSGPEFAEQAWVTYPGLKIIFMSGYPAEAARRNGFFGAGQVLLNKPFLKRQLAEALRNAIGSD